MNNTDKSYWTGKDFEFLITGDIELTADIYDDIMTPNTFICTKTMCDGWPYYLVESDYFTYSWEPPGIQMTFNPDITYSKAKLIADEVITNILNSGQQVELIELPSNSIYRF
ncbi:hypothetical protein [Mucilaginibacter defluvii]|uniref:Uncharacterized protein n=1 Tax=Mucilaginibacter defluvii TaxID=1196019 RepID=A0ABP9FT01_9SPHI